MSFFRSIVVLLLICASSTHASDVPARADLEAIVSAAYKPDAPGAAVIVVQRGEIVYRGARGLANLELGVPLRSDSVFRIGSVTKQFTAAAILLLAEEGKLALSDPVTRFLPDFHVQGHRVTIEQLLSHTSGIANYTELPRWQSTSRNDVSVQQLIDIFQDAAFDFEPGTRWKYDNSGYILLGAIIEKVSGLSYAEFLRTRVLEPLGMKNSRLDDSTSLAMGRAAGYMSDGARWRNADYVSMTQPFSAGSMLATVDDLARWNAAIEHGDLLKSASWQRAMSSFTLADGTPTRYGAGWIVGRVGPVATVEHGGGINGFNAYVLRAPAQQLYVAVLANASPPPTAPQEVAVQLAAQVLNVSLDAVETPIARRALAEYVGSYSLDGARIRRITRAADRLYAQDEDAARVELVHVGKDLFEVRADRSRFRFRREHGRVVAVEREPRILMGDRAPRVEPVR